MDRRSVIVLLLSFLLLMVWYPLTTRLFPPVPLPGGTNTLATATNETITNISQVATQAPTLVPAPEADPLSSQPFRPPGPEETLTVEDENARYVFTSHGGGVKLVELKQYRATVACDRKSRSDTNNLASLNTLAPVPALAILGAAELQGDGVFKLTKTDSGVRAEKSLPNGLSIVKEYRLSTNYLLKAVVRFVNRTSEPITLPPHEWVVGTATPMGARDESLMMGMQWYNGTRAEDVGQAYFDNRTMGCFPGQPRFFYQAGASNVFWASAHNQFFALIGVPDQAASGLLCRRVDLPPPTPEQLAEDSKTVAKPFGYQVSFRYPGFTLGPNQTLERRSELYAGPKEYYTLSRLGNHLDLVMRFGFFGFFAKALLLSMNGLHALGLSYGLAIIVITVIIKLAFWPLTNASTKSMKRMAALQPQMKAIQEKYKDDPRKMNMKLMEFMKENRVSPLGGCLPMVLQIPVFIGFYTMLQSAIELRGARFLWACDLSRGDTIWTIPGVEFPINPMPLLMGATMLWQARMTPPSPGMDPVQQSIMKYMPLLFMVFLYNFSAGLTLYWTVQNLLTIVQMKVTRATDPRTLPGAKPTLPASAPMKKKHRP
ncbi:MAG: membrane protein insertase YidC [Verrucomicrobia bacterium]|nr:membrane protein insertase YidC [Verrucomicrobiota bacterium]